MPRTSKTKTVEKSDIINNETTVDNIHTENTAQNIIEQINNGVDEVIKEIGTPTENTRINKTDIDFNEEIACKSVTFGGLTWVSPKTNSHYRWERIGSVEYIPFNELITMNNTSRQFLFKPMIVVQDSRAAEYFRLIDVYSNVAQVQNLSNLFNKPLEEISKVIDLAIKVNMRDVMISRVRQLRKDGTLNNIDIINLLEKKLCFDLSDDTTNNSVIE